MKNHPPLPRILALLAAAAGFVLLPLAVRAADQGGMGMNGKDMPMSGEHMGMAQSGSEITVTGEVLDMACYLDHGAHGEKHAACAQKCISSGLPVGLKAADGTTYLLLGEHAPANDMMAPYGGKTVTVKGKFVSRDGINLLENIELVK